MREYRRRSIRLKEYDYSQPGQYFITICVQHRSCLFGQIKEATCILSPAGEMVDAKWRAIAERFPMVELGPYVIMPNHIHGLIHIDAPDPDTPTSDMRSDSIGSIIQWFKTGTTYDYISGVKTEEWPTFDGRLWQRNYWEHVVRHERDYDRIADYIETNPSLWNEDTLHPDIPWTSDGRPMKALRSSG
jgi:REP element-mobilizing transposase RayT